MPCWNIKIRIKNVHLTMKRYSWYLNKKYKATLKASCYTITWNTNMANSYFSKYTAIDRASFEKLCSHSNISWTQQSILLPKKLLLKRGWYSFPQISLECFSYKTYPMRLKGSNQVMMNRSKGRSWLNFKQRLWQCDIIAWQSDAGGVVKKLA